MPSTDIISASTNADQKFLSERIEELSKMDDLQKFCDRAIDTLGTLLKSNEQQCGVLEAALERQKADLVTAAAEHARATAALASENQEKASCEAELRAQESRIHDLEADINRSNGEIDGYRRRIQEEQQRRNNAALDIIPLFGIINAIISGDARRAIPFYSQIDAIVSAIGRDLEAAEDRLNRTQAEVDGLRNQANETHRQIQESRQKIADLQQRAVRSQNRINECDRMTKATGQELTRLQDIRVCLKMLREKYLQTQRDVEIVMDTDASFIPECLNDFRQLLLAP